MKNYNVFSKHLIHCFKLREEARLRKTIHEENLSINMRELVKNYASRGYDPYLFTETPHSANKIVDEEIFNTCSYKICVNNGVRTIIKWCIKNIIGKFDTDSYETTYVKIRIATDMLNKLYYSKEITKEQNIYFHDNFVNNILELKDDFIFEELPFLYIRQYFLCSLECRIERRKSTHGLVAQLVRAADS